MIKVDNLKVKFNKDILKGISFSVDKGEMIVILGKSGSGKTTLLNALLGILKYQGTIKVDSKAQIVFQNPQESLDPTMSIGKQLEEVKKHFQSSVDINHLLEKFSLDKEVLNKKAKEISLGQAQRVQIIRALSANTEIILLDEGTSALDNISQKEILKHIDKINKEDKKTILFVTHNIAIAKYLKARILLIEEGELVYDGKDLGAPELKMYIDAMVDNW